MEFIQNIHQQFHHHLVCVKIQIQEYISCYYFVLKFEPLIKVLSFFQLCYKYVDHHTCLLFLYLHQMYLEEHFLDFKLLIEAWFIYLLYCKCVHHLPLKLFLYLHHMNLFCLFKFVHLIGVWFIFQLCYKYVDHHTCLLFLYLHQMYLEEHF
jgi:hypothetical protein